jgi:hemoglobin/transferrin/lactoferrin receptor protein
MPAGAARSRSDIQNFSRRGACVRGLTTPGSEGRCGSGGGILIATGETLIQVQNRVLGSAGSAPLFKTIPGYGLIGVRGGYPCNHKHVITVDGKNIADKGYRAPGWGIWPGPRPGARYQFRF